MRLVGWAHGPSAISACFALIGLLSLGCEQQPAPGAPPPAASSAAKPAPVQSAALPKPAPKPVLSCRDEKQGARFLVGEVGKALPGSQPRGDDEDEGDAIDLPFAVEVGGAVPTSDGFALAALENQKAVVVTVARDAASGSRVELTVVHGDVEPPRLASNGDRVVAAVVGNDAGSSTLTLMTYQPRQGATTLKRGAQVSRRREAAGAFDLELGATRGLMVWEQWDAAKSHGKIEALNFDAATVQGVGEPRVLSAADDDAEAPRVMPRKGGFWVSWASHGPPAKTTRAEARADAGSEAEYDSVVDVAPRRLKLLPVDERGTPTAEPRLVTAPDAHVLAYDAVAFGDGVLFAWRDDPTTLGAEAPKIHLARVLPDGTVALEVIEDEEVAEGAPRLFSDRDAAAQPRTWLALMGKRGRSRVGYVEPTGKLAGPLADIEGFGHNEPLALESRRFLLGQPRGHALDLSVVRCALASAKPQK